VGETSAGVYFARNLSSARVSTVLYEKGKNDEPYYYRSFLVAFFNCCLAILIIACGSTGTNPTVVNDA